VHHAPGVIGAPSTPNNPLVRLPERGENHENRGREWRYHTCPGPTAARGARTAYELRVRPASPAPAVAESERRRLATRLAKLRHVYSWGDIEEAEYRRAKAEADAAPAALPTDSDRIVLLAHHRGRVASLGDEMVEATPELVPEVLSQIVERVETRDQRVVDPVGTSASAVRR
jgi:hypothetical protein